MNIQNNGILIIDIDGVLCDFVNSFLSVANGIAGTHLIRSDIKEYDLRNYFSDWIVEQVVKDVDVYKKALPMPGAIRFFEKLKKQYHGRIIKMTARPINNDIIAATMHWLHMYSLNAGYLSFMSIPDKLDYIEGLSPNNKDVTVVIDDNISVAIEAKKHVNAYLIDAPYNRDQRFINRIMSINDINIMEDNHVE